jgi:dihydropteroate synthase
MKLVTSGRGEMHIGRGAFVWGSRTYIMGVVNVTPDSFSGDGLASDPGAAAQQALRFEEWGADLIDVGGESTRPPSVYSGVSTVTAEEEVSRVIPAIEAMVRVLRIPVSVDTYKAAVAKRAIDAGASMINDVWSLRRDPEIADVAADTGVPVVLMHNQEGTEYRDLVPDVIESLRGAMGRAVDAGVSVDSIVLDPGMGFGKTVSQSLTVLRRLDELSGLGQPLLVGSSRKSSIGQVLNLPVDQRLEGTAATVALSIAGGADIVRVHDVKEMVRVARMSDAIVRGWEQD